MNIRRILIMNFLGISTTIISMIIDIIIPGFAPNSRYFDSLGLFVLFCIGLIYSLINIYCAIKDKTYRSRYGKRITPGKGSLYLGSSYLVWILITIIYNLIFSHLRIDLDTIFLFSFSILSGIFFLIGGVKNTKKE